VLVSACLAAACAGDPGERVGAEPSAPASPTATAAASPTPTPSPTVTATVAPSEAVPPADTEPDPAVDPGEVGADELGLVPVIMYHRLRDDPGDFDTTARQFRRELVWLFDNGYRPIRTVDLARGDIDIPAGTSPVVLTFDDSTREQAALTDDGRLEPDTSMGILVDVASRYDDVEPVASLYVITSSLFGGGDAGDRVLVDLHERGMEIGNHTHTHPSLSSLDAAGVRRELARNVAEITDRIPDAEVATIALPLGIAPDDRSLLAQGRAAGTRYRNLGALLVGSNPAPSPFHDDFRPLAIPRIRSSPAWDGGEPDYGSRFWLRQLERSDGYRRYVSDGDPSVISFPADRLDELAPRFADRANPY
jgi:hypothetical protein